jgi:molybdopterin molybdotransferase
MADLLSVEQALAQILVRLPAASVEQIEVEDVRGRVLATDIVAPIDLPIFANSAMDGFAVRSEDVSPGVKLTVVMDIPAGVAPPQVLGRGEAARIMTGAPLPDGADAVVPVERTDAQFAIEEPIDLGARVEVRDAVRQGSNVRQVGENVKRGTPVLDAGTVLRPQDVGMLVGLGARYVSVYRVPRVVILGTGDELVGPGEPLTPGKIRDTNSYTVAGLVQDLGGEAVRFPPAKDTVASVRALFEQALAEKPDMIVSTAGVSVGVFDVVRTVLDELGEIGFWRVNVRPGKPLAFGEVRGVPFFGLPGNPVSAMVTFDVFVRPALRRLMGLPPEAAPQTTAITGEAIQSDGRRTYVRVRLRREGEDWVAVTTGTQSSGALMSMVLADGLLIIPEGQTAVPAGARLPVRLLRNLNYAI